MKKLVLLASLILMGCNSSVKGNFEVNETIKLEAKRATVQMPAGQYEASIKVNKKKKYIELEVEDIGRHNDFRFYFDNTRIPLERSGRVVVDAQTNGQGYDVEMIHEKTVNESDVIRRTESCTYQERYRECFGTPSGTACRDVWRDVYGSRRVEFRTIETISDITANLLTPGTSNTEATFNAQDHHIAREYLYEGYCR